MATTSLELADILVMNAIRLTRTLRALHSSIDLTGPEISALAAIVYAERIAARDLARLEEVTPATISRLVSAMERKRLVVRTPDTSDSRLQWISATAIGARRIREGHARRLEPLVAELASLPWEKRKQLNDAAQILADVIFALQAVR